jgi:hypothetical protein
MHALEDEVASLLVNSADRENRPRVRFDMDNRNVFINVSDFDIEETRGHK